MKVLGIILVAIPLSCLAAIIKVPENYVGKIDDDFTLECKSNGEQRDMRWFNNKVKMINTPNGVKDEFKNKYEIVKEGGRFDLIVKNPTIEDGGIYRCMDDSEDKEADAILVTEPSYSSKPERIIEKQNVTHTCESLIGSPEDISKYNIKMELQLGGKVVHTETNIEKLSRVTNNQHRLKLVYSRNALFNDKDVKCILSAYNPDFKISTNATVDIKYGPRDMKIEPFSPNSDLYIGDVLNCTVDANPDADIKWKSWIPSKPNVAGRDLVLTRQHVGSNTYECIAENQPSNVVESIKKRIEFTVLDRTRPVQASSSKIATNLFLLSSSLYFAKNLLF
ncbi:DgyrCDS4034 [Dimorphilus gyrociliatus]|uniref:DgyrCDS4034 n=1 Tax=Dimorphilus gyrociliatus TaxID=2664684 RepID=A0A7I8VKA6_9ANNE|nr:DgyrCDS4034 [Dimorphilus gyrociliatus]